jgi:uncharacterized protein (DUF1778 family)
MVKQNKAPKGKRGRPRTDVKWVSIGIRLKEDEKPRVDSAADASGVFTASFIRRATLAAVKRVESGKSPALPEEI